MKLGEMQKTCNGTKNHPRLHFNGRQLQLVTRNHSQPNWPTLLMECSPVTRAPESSPRTKQHTRCFRELEVAGQQDKNIVKSLNIPFQATEPRAMTTSPTRKRPSLNIGWSPGIQFAHTSRRNRNKRRKENCVPVRARLSLVPQKATKDVRHTLFAYIRFQDI